MTPPDFYDTDADFGGAAIGVAPPTLANLGKVRAFLVEEASVEDASEQLEPAQRVLIQGLVSLVETLCARTEWPRDTLLREIGCPARTQADLHGMDQKELKDCTAFLKLVDRTAQLVDLSIDRRAVVMECSRLLKATQENAKGLQQILKRGTFSPLQYIALGEISRAAEVAREQRGIASDTPEEGTNPFDGAPVTHLSVPRVDLYVRGKQELIGERVFDRITKHLQTCDGCLDSVVYQRSQAAD